MRVLFCESVPMWSWTLPMGFCAEGHATAFSGEVTEERLEALFATFRPDLVVTLGWGPEHTPEKLDLIRDAVESHGAIHAYWALEDPVFFREWSLPFARRARPHVVFTPCSATLPLWPKHGFPAALLEFAGFPFPPGGAAPPRPDYDVVLVATWYDAGVLTFRRECVEILLKPILRRGYRLAIWGDGWSAPARRLGIPGRCIMGPLPYEETARAYRSAAVVLGLQNSPTHLTQRTFEVLSAGGFLLTRRTPAVERHFVPGRHLAVSASPEETVAVLDRYLAHPEARLAVAAAGQAEVRAKHTYALRARQALRALERIYPYARLR